MVRTAYRGLVAGALGLPLMLGAPSVALASDYDGNSDNSATHRSDDGHKKGKHAYFTWIEELNSWVKVYEDNREAEQSQTNETEQENANTTTVYQISFANKGDTSQSLANETEQENESEPEQAQAVDQSTNVNQPAGEESSQAQSQKPQSQEAQAQESQSSEQADSSQMNEDSAKVK